MPVSSQALAGTRRSRRPRAGAAFIKNGQGLRQPAADGAINLADLPVGLVSQLLPLARPACSHRVPGMRPTPSPWKGPTKAVPISASQRAIDQLVPGPVHPGRFSTGEGDSRGPKKISASYWLCALHLS